MNGEASEWPIWSGLGTLEAAEIRDILGRDDPVILEVGANCGQTTAEMLREMPQATIHSFEPDPRAVRKFRENITAPGVELHEVAIGAERGTITFHQSSGAEHVAEYAEGWDQSGSIRPPNTHTEVWPWIKFDRRIEVAITTLDSWAAERGLTEADFIWADVQGAESDMIDGAQRILSRTKYLYTEYSNEEWYEGQITLKEMVGKLPDFELLRRYPFDVLFRNVNLT